MPSQELRTIYVDTMADIPKNFTGIVEWLHAEEREWYQDGKKHRLEGPASVSDHGNQYYLGGIFVSQLFHEKFVQNFMEHEKTIQSILDTLEDNEVNVLEFKVVTGRVTLEKQITIHDLEIMIFVSDENEKVCSQLIISYCFPNFELPVEVQVKNAN